MEAYKERYGRSSGVEPTLVRREDGICLNVESRDQRSMSHVAGLEVQDTAVDSQ